ncbi:unnamed protein product [Prorocentrum cordatum]|uniref:Uncharacterized protein n=1 Tax=Prorocentrum cordatum TaxID=2364126 RepID=A0ABN9UYI1_9DINO|nr:unnamed protein product [Polarella glacialis]
MRIACASVGGVSHRQISRHLQVPRRWCEFVGGEYVEFQLSQWNKKKNCKNSSMTRVRGPVLTTRWEASSSMDCRVRPAPSKKQFSFKMMSPSYPLARAAKTCDVLIFYCAGSPEVPTLSPGLAFQLV